MEQLHTTGKCGDEIAASLSRRQQCRRSVENIGVISLRQYCGGDYFRVRSRRRGTEGIDHDAKDPYEN
jgi:hypothetical protein